MNLDYLGWQVFLSFSDDKECAIYIDMAASRNAALPHVAVLSHKLASTTDRGFPEDDEYDALGTMEDALTHAVDELKGKYVGRLTCDGERVYYAYFPENVSESLVNRLKSMPYDLEVEADFDPEWQWYHTALCPSPEELCCMRNRCMVEAMQTSGIDLSVSRTVDHWLYFPTHDARLQAEHEVKNQGFRVNASKGGAQHEALPWSLHATKSHALDRDTLDSVSLSLARVAEQFEGQYDGWGVDFEGDRLYSHPRH